MCDIKLINFQEHYSSLKELFPLHWNEVASCTNTRTLNVNEKLFFQLEDMGLLVTFGVFLGTELVGYAVSILQPDTHDSTKTLLQNDALFVKREHRGGTVGLRLIKEVEKWAANNGVYALVWHAKPNTPLDKLFSRLDGYGVKDILYMKEV